MFKFKKWLREIRLLILKWLSMQEKTQRIPFPSNCVGGGDAKDGPQLLVEDLGDNCFRFQIEGTPRVTGIYNKFNLDTLRQESPEQKYKGIVTEERQYDDGHGLFIQEKPYEDRKPVMVRVIWYRRMQGDVEIKTTKLNEPVEFTVNEGECVRGRVYIVNSPSERDTGDPLGDDPPWYGR